MKEISSKVLNMRFMQRAQEKDLEEKFKEQQRRIEDESQWVLPVRERITKLMKGTDSKRRIIQNETSYMPFQNVVSGRRRYQDFDIIGDKLDVEVDLDLPSRESKGKRYMKSDKEEIIIQGARKKREKQEDEKRKKKKMKEMKVT